MNFGSASCGGAESPANGARGQKISGNELNSPGSCQVGHDSLLEEIPSAAGSRKEQLAILGGEHVTERRFTEASERFVFEIGHGKERVEGLGQFVGEDSMDLDSEIVPAARHSIALIFRGNIESADETDLFVADEEFSMVAKSATSEGNGIEPTELSASLAQRIPEMIG